MLMPLKTPESPFNVFIRTVRYLSHTGSSALAPLHSTYIPLQSPVHPQRVLGKHQRCHSSFHAKKLKQTSALHFWHRVADVNCFTAMIFGEEKFAISLNWNVPAGKHSHAALELFSTVKLKFKITIFLETLFLSLTSSVHASTDSDVNTLERAFKKNCRVEDVSSRIRRIYLMTATSRFKESYR